MSTPSCLRPPGARRAVRVAERRRTGDGTDEERVADDGCRIRGRRIGFRCGVGRWNAAGDGAVVGCTPPPRAANDGPATVTIGAVAACRIAAFACALRCRLGLLLLLLGELRVVGPLHLGVLQLIAKCGEILELRVDLGLTAVESFDELRVLGFERIEVGLLRLQVVTSCIECVEVRSSGVQRDVLATRSSASSRSRRLSSAGSTVQRRK